MSEDAIQNEESEVELDNSNEIKATDAPAEIEIPAEHEASGSEASGVESSAESEPTTEPVESVEEPVAEEPVVVEEELNEFGFSAAEMVEDDDEEEEEEDEDVSPIEEFVDEAAIADGEEVEMEWYILKVQVNRENSICDNLKRRIKVAGLERYFGEVLVPTEDVREFNKAGKQRIAKRKLYPGYIVVNMEINDDSWFLVRETSGIGDFTGAAGKPAPLMPEEIARIIATSKPLEVEGEGTDDIKTAIPFKVGDRVRVKEGYFQNHEGEVSTVDERNGRITVMINIFGRLNPVELDHWHVENV